MPLIGVVDVEQAGVYGLLVLLGGGLQWFFNWLAVYLGGRRKDRLDDEKTTIDRYHELYERQERDNEECRKDVERLEGKLGQVNDRVLVLTVSVVRAVGWIKYQEGLLRVNNIPHEPWKDEPDVGHGPARPAPPAVGPEGGDR